jgi:WD40 repeat protein
MTAEFHVRPSPYVGPRAFQEGETLYGRDREVMELLDLLIAERIVLLYSPSGAGKTSLVQAKLIPELKTEGFRVLPPVRVRLEPPETGRPANRYVLSVLSSLEESLAGEAQMSLEELAGLTLAEYLDRRATALGQSGDSRVATEGAGEARGASDAGVVLIFDQFEEVLTVDPTDREAKAEFFVQVGEALRDWGRWALFSMREEFVARLDPYVRPVPTRLATTYRLELLGEEAARLAVQEPARGAGVEFTDAAAVKLVDDLRRVRVQRPDGTTQEQLGPYVEPVQLQVVCRRLWGGLPADDFEIDEADVVAVGDVDTALRGYYSERVAALAATAGVREREIREWFDRRLITEYGIRGQVLQGPEESEGLANRGIWPLVDAHLVRAEQRRGATWFELAHDRLIEPVRADNAAWREEHLSTLQRQAALWEGQGRPGGLLLREQALVEAEAWAEVHKEELTEVEREFLTECREARAIEERERMQALRIRRLAVGATIFGIIAILLAVAAGLQWQRAERAVVTADEQRDVAVSAVTAEATARLGADYARRMAEAEGRRADRERDAAVSAVTAEATARLGADYARETAEAERQRAEQQSLIAQSGQIAAVARNELDRGNSERALLLAIGAYRTADTVEAEDAIHQALGAWHGREVMSGHEETVYGCGITPDGQTVVTVGEKTLHLWEIGGERRTLALRGHEGGITDAEVSPDGRYIATTSRDGTGRLWEVETGVGVWRLDLGDEGTALAFSPNGQYLALGSLDGRIEVWDVRSRILAVTLQHDGWGFPLRIAFSPDSVSLAAAYNDNVGRVWRPEGLVVLEGHTGVVRDIVFSPNGQLLATVSDDQTARLWNPATGEPIAVSDDCRGLSGAIAFSSDGRYIAASSYSGMACLWDVRQPDEKPALLAGHQDAIWSLAFGPDARTLATASWDGTARLWDVETRALKALLAGHTGRVWSLYFDPEGEYLCTASDDQTGRLWNVLQGGEAAIRHHQAIGRYVGYGPDGRTVVSVQDGAFHLWDLDTDQEATTAIELPGVLAAALSPDGSWLAVAGDGGRAMVWDLTTGRLRATLALPQDVAIHGLAFHPDGRYLALAGQDGTVRVWDMEAGAEEAVLAGHENDVYAVVFSVSGEYLATAGGDGTVRVWDWSQGEIHRSFETPAASIWAVALSRDGRYLAAGNHSGEIWIWDLTREDGHREQLLRGELPIRTLAFSPDGPLIAAGGEDGVVRVWDWRAGEAVNLGEHDRWITSLAFDPNGEYLATTGHDGTVRVWSVDAETTIDLACARVSRDLSEGEWQRYVGEIPYPALCPEAVGRDWVEAERLPPPGAPIPSGSLLPTPSPPTIYYFEAIPGTQVVAGQAVILRWDLSNARAAYLVYGDEEQGVTAPNEIAVTPTETTEYRLVAYNDVGQTEMVLRITVEGD